MQEYEFKRVHERRRYNANIVFAHRDKAYNGTIKDISLGGAFITSASVNLFSVGDLVTVSIPFTTGKKHVKRAGRIKWVNNEGFAIEFQ